MPRLNLHAAVETWPLKSPFRIFGHTWHDLPVLLVTLSDGIHTGRGEAAGVYYCDDLPPAMLENVERVRGEIEAGITHAELQSLLPAGGARNAVDCALWELTSRRAGKPVWALADLNRPRPLTTTCTLGAETPEIMARGAREYRDARALKLKLTGEADLDAERVAAVRRTRPDVWLGVDANQAYSPDTLEAIMPALVDARVAMLEQPYARGREQEFEGYRSPVPIAADESVQDSNDIEPMAKLCDIVNIKLDKCGGLTEALKMVDEIRRHGLEVMVGNMLGTSLAMAPAYLIGQFCTVVDLDGPLFLTEDRPPPVRYADGNIECTDQVWGTGEKA